MRGDPPGELYAWVGTFDRANGCWVVVRSDHMPAGLHPVAQVVYPPGGPGAKSVIERYELKERC